MLTCFVCKIVINNPEELFRHIKKDHKICGESCMVQCTLCGSVFTSFATFKKNVLSCFGKMPIVEEVAESLDPDLYSNSVDADVLNFEKALNNGALELVCGMCSNMNSSRIAIYNAISAYVRIYMSIIVSGIYYNSNSKCTH